MVCSGGGDGGGSTFGVKESGRVVTEIAQTDDSVSGDVTKGVSLLHWDNFPLRLSQRKDDPWEITSV